ncbi:hypothetical protein OG799_16440 [Micromonospora sp. NBC_00898]|nr:hypothetical protein OG799_16440 [Micromonospora sp. NBC_00898]
MLSAPVDAVPQGPRLVYEPKWDGFRAIAFVEAAGVYLQSRAGKNLTPYFPDITRALRSTFPPGVVVDGELAGPRQSRQVMPSRASGRVLSRA